MCDKVDILLVQSEQQTVGVIAPFAKAKVGDLVQYNDGCIGKVVDSLEWLERDSKVQGFVMKILDIFEVEAVFNLGYMQEGETNGA